LREDFEYVRITDLSGQEVQGRVEARDDSYEVRLEHGPTLRVPAELLEATPMGGFVLHGSLAELSAAANTATATTAKGDAQQTIALAAETLTVDKRQVTRGRVVVRKRVVTHDAVVDEPLAQEQLEVTRVPVNKLVKAADPPRTEGDTTVIPLYEEVLVVEKRLVLTEELHVSKRRSERREPQTVALRREEAVVERQDLGEGKTEERETM
jgi:uncharacterized protein (TIGR02271 family)